MMDESPKDLTREISEELIPPESPPTDDDVEVPAELEKWKSETKGVERIISIAITTSQPRTVEWIAEQALVAEQTARDHLKMFAELGIVASFTSSGVTRYHADEAFVHYREVSRCVEQHSKEELSEEVEQLQEAIARIKEEHDIATPDELRARAAEADIDTATLRQYKKSASEWETIRDRLEVLEDALRRFEKFDGSVAAQA